MIPQKKVLMFITDGKSVDEIVKQVKEVLAGGCFWIQLRMKDFTDEDIEKAIREIKPICDKHGATLIIDDRVDFASKYSLDGVHLGDDDMSVEEARNILGDKVLIGVTANTIEHIILMSQKPMDYFGVGPYKFTTTKKNLKPIIGLQGYHDIFTAMQETGVDKPMVAIGGIDLQDVNDLMEIGIWGVAVSGAIAHSKNPKKTTEEFMNVISGF